MTTTPTEILAKALCREHWLVKIDATELGCDFPTRDAMIASAVDKEWRHFEYRANQVLSELGKRK